MLGVLGINHKAAAQDIRQCFSFTKEEILTFSELLQQKTTISELVILSTCNRTEIYYFADGLSHKKGSLSVIELLHEFKQVEGNHAELFYQHKGAEAVKHLFRVISGMDSVVIGEDQIVSQVKDAYLFCTENALTDAVLMRLFQKSFEASKRVRTDTKVQKGATSISYVAVDLCAKIYTDLPERTVMIIGSGETGALAYQKMKKKGVTKAYITNRTFSHAVALTAELGGEPVPFESFKHYLPLCDIVIVATGAQNYLITKQDVEDSLLKRDNNCQIFIDLSVPRNVDKAVEEIEEVKLYCVDDLQDIVNSNTDIRWQSVEEGHLIVDEVAEEYLTWFETLTLKPLIKSITANLLKIRETEMANYKSADDVKRLEVIDEYTNRITQKYIGLLIKNLKSIAKNNPSSHSLNVINDLFDFENH